MGFPLTPSRNPASFMQALRRKLVSSGIIGLYVIASLTALIISLSILSVERSIVLFRESPNRRMAFGHKKDSCNVHVDENHGSPLSSLINRAMALVQSYRSTFAWKSFPIMSPKYLSSSRAQSSISLADLVVNHT